MQEINTSPADSQNNTIPTWEALGIEAEQRDDGLSLTGDGIRAIPQSLVENMGGIFLDRARKIPGGETFDSSLLFPGVTEEDSAQIQEKLKQAAFEVQMGKEPDSQIFFSRSKDAPGQMSLFDVIEGSDRRQGDQQTLFTDQAISQSKKGNKVPSPAPEPKTQSAPFNTGGRLEDFGEKIEGARKDLYAPNFSNFTDSDIADKPLSKTWPEPNYDKMVAEGHDPLTVGLIRAIRDEVPRKPSTPYGKRRWVEQVKSLAGFVTTFLERPDRRKTFMELLETKDSTRHVRGNAEMYAKLGHANSLAKKRLFFNRYSEEGDPSRWSVRDSLSYKKFATGSTKEEAIENFRGHLEKENAELKGKKRTKFDVYSRRTDGKYFVGKKVGREVLPLSESFGSMKEAFEYLKSNQEILEENLHKAKEIPAARNKKNAPRVGKDYRKGKDVTPEKFTETFGFRGVQFGNYVEQKKRQKDLNDTFDGLLDLAGILNIPPRALSLNGTLGLAFGARGKGGKDAGRAHFEPENIVINLTKKRGAGSLGHEWWHSLDNYFSRMDNRKSGYVTDLHRPNNRDGAIRPEMVEAFANLIDTIQNQTDMRTRSTVLDKRRSTPYWATGKEMSARAFERYVIEKLKANESRNDYLANISDQATWKAAEALGFELESSYPFPTDKETRAVQKAFDRFFQTIKTKETDQGVALYSREKGRATQAVAEVKSELEKPLSKQGVQALESSGRLVILGSQEEGEATVKELGKSWLSRAYTKNRTRLAGLIEQFKKDVEGLELSEEQQGIKDVVTGKRQAGAIRKKDLDSLREYVLLEKGNPFSRKGAAHIVLGHYNGKRGVVSAEEILNMGEVIRRGKATESKDKRIYSLEVNGVRFRAVVGKGNKGKDVVISFYSKRKDGTKLAPGHNAILGISPLQTSDTALSDAIKSENDVDVKYSDNGKIQGFTNGNTVYLVADGIKKDHAWNVFLHEAGVHANKLLLSNKNFELILGNIDRWQHRNDETGQIVREAFSKVPKDTNPEHRTEEALAYLVEHHPEMGIVRRFISLVKRLLAQAFGKPFVNMLPPADLRAMAQTAARRMARETVRQEKAASKNVAKQEERKIKPVPATGYRALTPVLPSKKKSVYPGLISIGGDVSSWDQIIPYGEGRRNDENYFGGLFASPREGSGSLEYEVTGDNQQIIYVPEEKIASHDEFMMMQYDDEDYIVLENTIKGVLADHKGVSIEDGTLTEEELEEIQEYIVEEKHLSQTDPEMGMDRLEEILCADVADWDIQGLRGEVARRLGWAAVEMEDETGYSVLVLRHPSVKFATKDSEIDPDNEGHFFLSMAKVFGVSKEQLAREYQAVVDRFKGTDQWMKAPNGEDTNLNERQWVLVRTPRFKAWFGNWEMNRDKEIAAVEIADRIFNGDRKAAQEWLLDPEHGIVGTHHNEETGMDIVVSNRILKRKSTSGDAVKKSGTPLHYEAMRKLPELLEKCSLVAVEADKSNNDFVMGVYKFVAPIQMTDHFFTVKLTVKDQRVSKEAKENKFYTHELIEIEMPEDQIPSRDASIAGNASGTFQESSSVRLRGGKASSLARKTASNPVFTVGQLIDSVNKKSPDSIPEASKVVDENGEPLVVYHGSEAAGFTTFDNDKLGSNTNAISARLGHFFAKKRETAKSYLKTEHKDPLPKEIAPEKSLLDIKDEDLKQAYDIFFKDEKDLPFHLKVSDVEQRSFIIATPKYENGELIGFSDTKYFVSFTTYFDPDIIAVRIGSQTDFYDFGAGDKEFFHGKVANPKDVEHVINKVLFAPLMEEKKGQKEAQKYMGGDFGKEAIIHSGNVYEVFLNLKNPLIYNQKQNNGNPFRAKRYAKILEEAHTNGHDGAILQNTFDGAGVDDIHVVFSPNQIKSATGNTGAFDGSNPDIRYSMDLPKDILDKKTSVVQGDSSWLNGLRPDQARKRTKGFAFARLKGSYKNKDAGWEIDIAKKGILKSLSGERSLEELQAIKNLPELIQNAVKVVSRNDRDNNPDIKQIHRFFAPLMLDDLFVAKLTVKETMNGKKFYDHALTKIEKPDSGYLLGHTLSDSGHQARKLNAGSEIRVGDLLSHVNEKELKFSRTSTPEASGQNVESSTAAEQQYEEDKETAWNHAVDAFKGFLKYRNDKGDGSLPDVSNFAHHFATTMYKADKVGGAAKRVVDIFRKQADWKYEKQRELLYDGDEHIAGLLNTYRKQNKAGYKKLNRYVVERDVNAIGYKVQEEKDDNGNPGFVLYDTNGRRMRLLMPTQKGKKPPFLPSFEKEDEAWEYAWKREAALSGLDEQGQDCLKAYRLFARKLYLHYAKDLQEAIESYKAADMPIPEIVTIRDGKEVQIDLETLAKEMGDRQGYYFPRLRSAGKYRVFGQKDGRKEHKYFDTRFGAAKYRASLDRKGYETNMTLVGKLSEDIFQALEPLLAMQQTINKTLGQISSRDKERLLSDRNLFTELRGDTLVLKGSGLTADLDQILGSIGGRFVDHYEQKGNSKKYTPEIHFDNVGEGGRKAKVEEITKRVLYSGGLFKDMDMQFAAALAKEFDAVLKGRGSRARMIARTDAVGEDVSRGYEEDLITAMSQAGMAAAGGYAKGQIAQKATAALMGRDITWEDYLKEHDDGTVDRLEVELKALEIAKPEELKHRKDLQEQVRKLRGTLLNQQFSSLAEVERVRGEIARLQREIQSISQYSDKDKARKIKTELNTVKTNLYESYQKMAQERSIQADKQANIYKDLTAALKDILRNEETADRIIGSLKGLAVWQYLGFRVSSVFINVTNMVTGMPAVINGETDDAVPLRSAIRYMGIGMSEYVKSRKKRPSDFISNKPKSLNWWRRKRDSNSRWKFPPILA